MRVRVGTELYALTVVLNDGGENLGWLDAKEGDGAIERRLVEARQQSSGSLKIGKETTYVLTVCTGKVAHAGTNANVFVTLYGEGGESGERKLDSKRGHFEKGQEDIFRISVRRCSSSNHQHLRVFVYLLRPILTCCNMPMFGLLGVRCHRQRSSAYWTSFVFDMMARAWARVGSLIVWM
eukprot:COSAG05_NODE_197_length_14521_cov_113.902995_3_plen_180_part_00